MNIGINIPHMGAAAGAENIVRVAQKAEELGFATVWVTERVLYPTNPQTAYGGTADGSLPDAYRIVFDPLDSLAWAAAHTKKIGIGTSVLDMPYYNPVILARRVSTLDQLSGGRVKLGLGLGWSKDEMDATGANPKTRGKRADEFLEVLHTIWKDEEAEYSGKYFKLPKSVILPKPVQKPHPPLYLAAFAPAALNRVARLADGWLPVAIPVEGMRQMFSAVQAMAKAAGRDPSELKMIVRANIDLMPESPGEGRWLFTGARDDIKRDIEAVRELGAAEIHFDPSFSDDGATVQGFLDTAELVRELAG
jgi:probable F420-dependent oxidoreductase